MSFPSLFAILFAGTRLGRRRIVARWLPTLLIAMASLLGGSMAQAASYNFNGKDVDLDFCSRDDKVYTCSKSPWLTWNDQVTVGAGITLRITGDATPTYNHGLNMGNKSVLAVTGHLDLTDMNPATLRVNGATIAVDGVFSMGALTQSITADVTAGAILLGSAKVTVTGNLVSRGLVDISANSQVTGDISGTTITTSSGVTITGKVSATTRFTLGSGSSVTKDVTAPVFDMLASNSKVTGNIVATTSVTMGSGNTVTGDIRTGVFDMQSAGSTVTGDIVATTSVTMGSKSTVTGDVRTGTLAMQADGSRITGDVSATTKITMGSGTGITGEVDTGDLFLQSSRATITGNARVNWATLEWEGRVTGTIYCKNGTAKNTCDCVTNRSGWAVNTANGPRCEGAPPPPPSAPHHFLITHDGEGDTCLPEQITVTACANATCTAPHFSGAVSGQLTATAAGQTTALAPFAIDANTGSTVVSATRLAEGTIALGVASTTAACYRTGANTNSCAMSFAGGAKLLVDVPDHVAGTDGIEAAIRAVKANDTATACVPAFENVTYDVQYRCNYSKPKTGTAALALGGKSLSCAAAGTTAASQTIATKFGAGGNATALAIKYADVGEVRLHAYADTGKGMTAQGEGTFITGPASFKIAPAAGPIRAGNNFEVVLTAVNATGGTTPNFDNTALNNAGASGHSVVLDFECHRQGGAKGTLTTAGSFKGGAVTMTTSWSEVGNIDLKASLEQFMGIKTLNAYGSTNTDTKGGCAGNVGPFIPAYFKVELADPLKRTWYYSGEPFPLKISAMNAAGAVTTNYGAIDASKTRLSEDLVLAANDKSGAKFADGFATLTGAALAASAFDYGVALAKPVFTFGTSPTAPTQIRLRATNNKEEKFEVTSALPASAEETAMPVIRSGRLRLGSRFGGIRSTLTIPVTAEYWTGRSWLLNSDDGYTPISAASFAFWPVPAAMKPAPDFKNTPPTLKGGKAEFSLGVSEGGPGRFDIAVNLGTTDTKSNACDATYPDATGTATPWLRSVKAGCNNGKPSDPSARATFGVFAPENRRIIHVREVFN